MNDNLFEKCNGYHGRNHPQIIHSSDITCPLCDSIGETKDRERKLNKLKLDLSQATNKYNDLCFDFKELEKENKSLKEKPVNWNVFNEMPE